MDKWVKDFFDLQENGKEQEANSLKLLHIPKAFYKYRSLNKFTIDSLLNCEVYLQKVSNQNDPYDSYYSVDFIEAARIHFTSPNFLSHFKSETGIDMPPDYLHKIINNKSPLHSYIKHSQKLGRNLNANPDAFTAKQYAEWKKIVDVQREKIRVSCFSTKKDNVLMWSHYATNHSGICVEYDFSNDLYLQEVIQPVQYKRSQYDITARMTPRFNPSEISSGIYIAALTKAKDWSYENEWRLINNIGKEVYTVPKPKAIYLGTCFDKNKKTVQKKVLSIAKKLGIPIVSMKLHHSKYTIEPIVIV